MQVGYNLSKQPLLWRILEHRSSAIERFHDVVCRLGFAGVYGTNSTPILIPLTHRPKPQLYSLRILTLILIVCIWWRDAAVTWRYEKIIVNLAFHKKSIRNIILCYILALNMTARYVTISDKSNIFFYGLLFQELAFKSVNFKKYLKKIESWILRIYLYLQP